MLTEYRGVNFFLFCNFLQVLVLVFFIFSPHMASIIASDSVIQFHPGKRVPSQLEHMVLMLGTLPSWVLPWTSFLDSCWLKGAIHTHFFHPKELKYAGHHSTGLYIYLSSYETSSSLAGLSQHYVHFNWDTWQSGLDSWALKNWNFESEIVISSLH